jgi:hypothetical protein
LDRSRQLSGLLLFQASVNAVAEIPKAWHLISCAVSCFKPRRDESVGSDQQA